MTERKANERGGEGARWILILLVPLVALLALAGWIVRTGAMEGLLDGHQGLVREERALLAIDSTPEAEVVLLVAALQREPTVWDASTVRAAAALLARTDWPPRGPVGGGRLLSDRAPATWDETERATVRELLALLRRQRAPMDAAREPAW